MTIFFLSFDSKQHSDGEGESDHEDHVTAHSLKTLGCSPGKITFHLHIFRQGQTTTIKFTDSLNFKALHVGIK